jgi:hypothetical protein
LGERTKVLVGKKFARAQLSGAECL